MKKYNIKLIGTVILMQLTLLVFSQNLNKNQYTTTNQSIDSLGDLWIFVFDKSRSMQELNALD